MKKYLITIIFFTYYCQEPKEIVKPLTLSNLAGTYRHKVSCEHKHKLFLNIKADGDFESERLMCHGSSITTGKAELNGDILKLYLDFEHYATKQNFIEFKVTPQRELIALNREADFVMCGACNAKKDVPYTRTELLEDELVKKGAYLSNPERVQELVAIYAYRKDYKNVFKTYNVGLQKFPNNRGILSSRANTYSEIKEYRNALTDYEQLARFDATGEWDSYIINQHLSLGDYASAKTVFESRPRESNHSYYELLYAKIMFGLNDYKQGCALAEKALEDSRFQSEAVAFESRDMIDTKCAKP